MTDSIDLGGSNYVKLPKGELNKVGDVVQGVITSVKQIQQTDINTKQPKWWAPKVMGFTKPVGSDEYLKAAPHLQAEFRPVMDLILELDNAVSVYAANDLLSKIKKATQEVADGVIAVGGQIGIRLDELVPSGKGNPRKVHSVKYVPPVSTVKL
jgi:hypothetical protein